MAKLSCPCGNYMILSGDSNYEYTLLSDVVLDMIAKLINENKIDIEKYYDILGDNSRTVYRCDRCKRLYIYDKYNESESLLQYNIEYITPNNDDEGFLGPLCLAKNEQTENK